MRVVVEDVLAAFVSVWPTTGTFAGVPLRAHTKSPNDPADTYAVISCRETQPAMVESDGLAQQTFTVTIQVYSSRVPPITQAIARGLSTIYDGTTAAPNAGLTLQSPATIARVDPSQSATDRDPFPRAGQDMLVTSRTWQVVTNTPGG